MKKFFAAAFILFFALAAVGGITLVVSKDARTWAKGLGAEKVDLSTPQLLSSEEEVDAYISTYMVHEGTSLKAERENLKSIAMEQHPEYFKEGVEPPFSVALVPTGAGSAKIEITLPPSAEASVNKFGISEMPFRVDSYEKYDAYTEWVGKEYGQKPLWVKSQILASPYMTDTSINTAILRGFTVEVMPGPTLAVHQPDWFSPPPPPPVDPTVRFEPRVFETTEGLFAFLKQVGLLQFDPATGHPEGSKWSEYLTVLHQSLGITDEDEIPPFILHQYVHEGSVYEGFQRRYEVSDPLNTDLGLTRFAESVGVFNPDRLRNFLRSKDMVKRPAEGGKWKDAVVVKYDRHRKIFSVERVAKVVRGVIPEYANLVDFRVHLRQRQNLEYSSTEIFALVGKGVGATRISAEHFPLIYFIEEDVNGRKNLRFERGVLRQEIREANHLIWFADMTDHFDTREFFDRLIWWAKNELKVKIKDQNGYPYQEKPFEVIFDKTPEAGPEVSYRLLPQEAKRDGDGVGERVLLEENSKNVLLTEENIQKSEYLRGTHKPAAAAALKKFKERNPDDDPDTLVVTTKKYLDNGKVSEVIELTFAKTLSGAEKSQRRAGRSNG